jgi:hypothetical protein
MYCEDGAAPGKTLLQEDYKLSLHKVTVPIALASG